MEKVKKGLEINALIFGATGAVGKVLLNTLLSSAYYKSVTVIARRKLDEWDTLPSDKKEKFKYVQCGNMELFAESKEKILEALKIDFNYDTIFSCLGGNATDTKSVKLIDYDYMLNVASLCEKFNIPHFSLVSTKSADPKAFFSYVRIKGEADEAVKLKDIKRISIFRPPLLADREGAKFLEKAVSFIPFYTKIKVKDLAWAMLVEDVEYHGKILNKEKIEGKSVIYEYSEIFSIMERQPNY